MKLVKDVTVINPQGKEVNVDVEVWQRFHSIFSVWLTHYKGRRITPFEQRLRGWKWPLNAMFKIVYSEHIGALTAESNPFMNLIPKDNNYYQPVILGEDHGVK